MIEVPWVWAALLTMVFTASATSKLLDFASFQGVLRSTLRIGARWNRRLALVVLGAELAVVILGILVVVGARGLDILFGVACVMLVTFSAWAAYVMRQEFSVTCQCFGGSGHPVSWRTLMRNAILISATLIAAFLWHALSGSVEVGPAFPRGLIITTLCMVAAAASAFQFVRPHLTNRREARERLTGTLRGAF